MSIRRQVKVGVAEHRVKTLKGGAKKTAKRELRDAKLELKRGAKEYEVFMKDMHKMYGKSKNYTLDPITNTYKHKRKRKSIKEYEYAGIEEYDTCKQTKIGAIAPKAVVGAAFVAFAFESLEMFRG